MINEFHAALVNRRFEPEILGGDFIPPDWQPVEMDATVLAVWRAIMVNPEVNTMVNWRALEIRRCLPKTDLAAYRVKFDPRTGYDINGLIAEMVTYFHPLINGDSGNNLSVQGNLISDIYRVFNWQLNIQGTNWRLSSVDGELQADAGSSPLVTVTLPGVSQVTLTFRLVSGQYSITWASHPRIGMAQTAAELTTTVSSDVYSLAEKNSRFDVTERNLLRNVVLYEGEPVAKVCAASLLLAGHLLHERYSI